MAVVSRDLSITYNSYAITPANDRFLNEYVRENTRRSESVIEFEWVVAKTTDATLATEVALVRSSFRANNKRLQVSQGASSLLDLNPDDTVVGSENTGFGHECEIIKDGDEGDTGRSHTFRVRITVQLPANVEGGSGQRNEREQIVYDESRIRTVIMTGEWTALTTENSATDQYLANIDAYVDSLKTNLGISTWEQIGDEEVDRDQFDKTLNYRLVYRELLFNQASGVLDNAARS